MGRKKPGKKVHQNKYAKMSQAPNPESLVPVSNPQLIPFNHFSFSGPRRPFFRHEIDDFGSMKSREKNLDRAYGKGKTGEDYQETPQNPQNVREVVVFKPDGFYNVGSVPEVVKVPRAYKNYCGVEVLIEESRGGISEQDALQIVPQIKIIKFGKLEKAVHITVDLAEGKAIVEYTPSGLLKWPAIGHTGSYWNGRNLYGKTDDPSKVQGYNPFIVKGKGVKK